jgi:DNA-directed RNA polymerase subunit F
LLKKLGLNDETAVNLLNICPESEGEVRAVLVMEREFVYDVELVSNILSILKKLCSS